MVKSLQEALVTESQCKIRVAGAEEHSKWTIDYWKKVLFFDESCYNFRNHEVLQFVRRRTGETYQLDCNVPTAPTVKHPTSVTIWGCMTAIGVGCLLSL